MGLFCLIGNFEGISYKTKGALPGQDAQSLPQRSTASHGMKSLRTKEDVTADAAAGSDPAKHVFMRSEVTLARVCAGRTLF